MKKEINIALISSGKNTTSETFIQQHKVLLEGNVIHYYNGNPPAYNNIEGEIINYRGIRYLLYRLFGFKFYEILKIELKRSFKRNKIDILYIEYGIQAVALLGILKEIELPFIVNYHGYDISKYDVIEKYSEKYKEIFQKARAIVGVSQEMCDKFVQMGCDKDKIFYNPCSPNKLFLQLNPLMRKRQLLFVGRFTEKKLPYSLLLSFNKVKDKFPDAELVMIGDGPLFDTVKNLVNLLNVKDVELTGALSHQQVLEYFENSYLYVQHSVQASDGDKEGTPVAIMEASLAALPVVSTRHAGIKDVIIERETGILVDEFDVASMTDAICYLLDKRDVAFKMGQKGREFIMKSYSQELHAKRLNETVNYALRK